MARRGEIQRFAGLLGIRKEASALICLSGSLCSDIPHARSLAPLFAEVVTHDMLPVLAHLSFVFGLIGVGGDEEAERVLLLDRHRSRSIAQHRVVALAVGWLLRWSMQ